MNLQMLRRTLARSASLPKILTASRSLCTGASMDAPFFKQQRQSSSLTARLEKCWQEENATYHELSEDFSALRERLPRSMAIEDTPGDMLVKLKYKHNDESIEIEFDCDDEGLDGDEELAHVDEEEDQSADDDAQEEMPLTQTDFFVRITRGGKTLRFDCLSGETLSITGVSFETSIDHGYEGPVFEELDEDLQLAFHHYLNERHVNDDLAAFIAEYAELKESMEYVAFLDQAKNFVQ